MRWYKLKTMSEKLEKKADIWKRYNPVKYLLKLVQFEDEKRFLGVDLYKRDLISDNVTKKEKKNWKKKLKGFINVMMV